MGPKIRPRTGYRLAAALTLGALAAAGSGCAGPVPARNLGESASMGPARSDGANWSLVMPGPSSIALAESGSSFDWAHRRDASLSDRDGLDPLAESVWPEPDRPHLGDRRYRSFHRANGYSYDRRPPNRGYHPHSRGTYRRHR